MTEFCLILVLVIKSLNSVVCSFAFLLLRTLLCFSKLAEFRSVEIVVPPFVLYGVIIVTTFVVMWFVLMRANYPFEISKVQMFQLYGLACPMMHLAKTYEKLFLLIFRRKLFQNILVTLLGVTFIFTHLKILRY